MLHFGNRGHPTLEQCARVLRAAGLGEPLTSCDPLPRPDYSPNAICILNGRYVLRASTVDGDARFARERRALDQLRGMPGVPQVLGAGTLEPGGQARYLLQSRIPGRPVFPLWLDVTDEVRRRLIAQLVGHLRQMHAIPAASYVIGHYQSALRDWEGTWLAGHDAHMRRLSARVRTRPLNIEQADAVRAAEAFYAAHRTALTHTVGPRFAHGDLHLYNVLAEHSRIMGIIDWEWAYGGGTEPDFDLAHLVRWALYPADGAEEEELAGRVTAADYALLIPALLAAYAEVAATPRLSERMTIYQIEHELHQIAAWPGSAPAPPMRRLQGWLREQRLATYLP